MKIASLLPFLGKEEVDKLLEAQLQKDTIDIKEMVMFLPFASRSKLDEVIVRLYNENNVPTSKLASFFPFVSNNALHQLVIGYTQNGKAQLPDTIVPFLSSSDVKLLFEYELTHEHTTERNEQTGQNKENDPKGNGNQTQASDWVEFAEQMAGLGKSFIPNLGNMFKHGSTKVSADINIDNEDSHDNEDDQDIQDTLEDLDDALDDVGDALDDVNSAISDIDSTVVNEQSKEKLESLKDKLTAELSRIQDLLNNK
ncbi:MAG: hypothetical protein PHW00_01080 [Clostridia bacterium]|nr:hypothetical protein [Clostridia bacterium]